MNIAITAGLQLMPPAFSAGLSAWSSENGLTGDASWAGAANAAIVPADQDFGACLEILKQQDVTRLRFRGETPILAGTYLRISARIKAVAGNLPQVRIGAWAGTAGRVRVPGVTETGPAVPLPAYGQIVEVAAVVATGNRPGVDMAWGNTASLGHFGIDLIGPNGGAVRIESIRIEDVTAAFLPGLIDWVDVRDFGARGDGVTDDRAAFLRADTAAAGGSVLVPEGVYFIGDDLSMDSPVRFRGSLKMPRAARLGLRRGFDFPTYADAFGDETEGLKRGLQALFDYVDHGSFDLCGRKVDLTEPLVMKDIAPGLTVFSARRVLMNGQIAIANPAAFATRTVSSVGTYDPGNATELRGVAQVAQIEVGSRVTGPGVGREVYVRARNIAAGTLTLSQPLYGGAGTRSYTFLRYRYAFDFSGVAQIDRFHFLNIDFGLDDGASGVMLPPEGSIWTFRDCSFARPKDRAITSIGGGCQGMVVDRCDFLAPDMGELAQNRTSVAININSNDNKIRDNRFVRFGHFCVAAGTGHIISGNHWFQGDTADQGVRFAGLVLTSRNAQTTITGNYVDNASIEWTNEHHARPAEVTNTPFGGLTITGNTFLCSHTVPNFAWLVIKPFAAGYFVHGLTVTGNVFKALYANITRVDKVDTTFGDLDMARMRNIRFEGNSFNGIATFTANPCDVTFTQGAASNRWIVPTDGVLPFGGHAMKVESIIAESAITSAAGARIGEVPFVQNQQGAVKTAVALNFATAVKGSVSVKVRMDAPN
ncbi:glycosyl hydrolase family 28-related protein [Paracoccus luteus]|uniref:glycosyl hydrolase family 28-related protein n=1 Tax=Paracoccus luteus TaxID=2508543 RepID=UPI00106F0BB1|nr:glycosyl hydrolase family 28-related protein [Paracoccus luteus]